MTHGMKSLIGALFMTCSFTVLSLKAESTLSTGSSLPSLSALQDKHYQVDINQASAEELAEILNGVGLKKAEGIVRYRQESGPFKDADQLKDVPGIGAALIERNRNVIKW